ncbi:MAG TPA: class I SAM-dependent methyltransferase [Rubrivivax sp.]|nr:class I SAM-dependent methyltransferase [Rubrivivax sp.]HRZ62829.1 class I SAM-dependent methyltransferase [Rubrivivax sp.]
MPPHANWYERVLLPRLLDLACGTRPVRRQRAKVVPQAEGEVLEVGIGTGLNLPFYDRARVRRIVGVDPALQMHPLALRRVAATGISVELVGLSAERLPLQDLSFDTVVCTYALCSIPDAPAALAEVRRVLRPGGRLLFCEHGRAPDESVRRWQHRLQPLWGPLAGGCRLDVDVPALLTAAGFDAAVESRYLPGPRFASYHYWGVATVAAPGSGAATR